MSEQKRKHFLICFLGLAALLLVATGFGIWMKIKTTPKNENASAKDIKATGPRPENGIIAAEKTKSSFRKVPLRIGTEDGADYSDLTYRWIQIDGQKVKIADPNSNSTYFIPVGPGVYVFEITVSDGKASTAVTVRKIVTKPPDPIGERSGENGSASERKIWENSGSQESAGAKTTFKKVSLSFAGAGGAGLTYHWTQTGGPRVKIAEPNQHSTYFIPTLSGRYTFDCAVSDGKIKQTVKLQTIVENPVPDPIEDY